MSIVRSKSSSDTKAPLMKTVVDPNPLFCHFPLKITCPSCGQHKETKCVNENGKCAYVTAALVCVVFCPLFWVPLVIPKTKDWVHYCTNCDIELGRCRIL